MNQPTLPTGGRVLLDSMVFIYFLEEHPDHHATTQMLFERISGGTLTALASTLTVTELLVHPYGEDDAARADETFETLSSFPNLHWLDVTPRIAREAARIRAAYRLRTPDALHVATGILHNAGAIITNDRKWRRVEAESVRIDLLDGYITA